RSLDDLGERAIAIVEIREGAGGLVRANSVREGLGRLCSNARRLGRGNGITHCIERRRGGGVESQGGEELAAAIRCGHPPSLLHPRGDLALDAALELLLLRESCGVSGVDGEGDLALVESLAKHATGHERFRVPVVACGPLLANRQARRGSLWRLVR